jgi:hypothetical protein
MIEKILEPFGYTFGQLQDLLTLLKLLKRDNISIEEMIYYLEGIRKDKGQVGKPKQIELSCPECSGSMSLFRVNDMARTQVGEGLKSQVVCSKCSYEKFSDKNIQTWYKELTKHLVH